MVICACAGALVVWFLLGLFIYLRDDKGGISLWDKSWDVVLVLLPAIPAIFLAECVIALVQKRG